MSNTSEDNFVSSNRLALFSDAVIAITITLLALDIKVPKAETVPGLISALCGQWTNYLSYFITFFITGSAWINHHRMFTYITRTNNTLLVLNTFFLMWVAVIPFAAGLMAEYIAKPEAKVGTFIYGAILTISGAFLNVMWFYATSVPALLRPNFDSQEIKIMRKRYLVRLVIYAVATFSSLISATLSIFLYLSLIILFWRPIESTRKLQSSQ